MALRFCEAIRLMRNGGTNLNLLFLKICCLSQVSAVVLVVFLEHRQLTKLLMF
jgi:hypothetical protein